MGVIERSSGTLAQQRSACTQVCAAGLGYLAFVTITLELYYCYYFQNFLLPLLLLSKLRCYNFFRFVLLTVINSALSGQLPLLGHPLLL